MEERKKHHQHWFRICNASKLKTDVFEGTGGLLWFSVIVDLSSPIVFVGFYVPWIMMRTLSVNRFQSNLFYILYDIRYASRLMFLWTFFSMWSSVFVLCCRFSFLTRCCQYYMNYWTHPLFNCWQNRHDYWGCRNGKKKIRYILPYYLHWVTYFCEMWSEEFIYRSLNWSVKILLMNRDEDPPFF